MPITEVRPRRRVRVPPAAGFALALGLLCLFGAVGGPERVGALFFPLLSLWAGCLLAACVLAAVRCAGVRFGAFHWCVLAAVYLTLAICGCLQTAGRSFIYIWDYSNYLLLQYAAEEAFAAGPLAGLGWLLSTMVEDYTGFICLFTEFPFCLSEKTGDSFVVCQLVSVLPALLLALGGLTVRLGQLLGVANEQGFFLFGLSLTAAFPFLRMAAALGQPDWLGLVFALIILLLTIDYRFERPGAWRCVGLFCATAALILTRRWYLYFIVSYYLVYAVTVVAGSVRLARQGVPVGDRLRGLVTFGAGSVAALIILFWPIVRRILAYSYAEHYAAYNVGGLALELFSQFWRLGPLWLPLAVLGAVWGCSRGHAPLVGQTLATLALSLLLFTRVQNMGSHQTLLLLPGYLVLMLLGAAALAGSLARHRRLKLGYWLVTVAFGLSARLSPLTTVALPDFLFPYLGFEPFTQFVELDTMIYDRSDTVQVRALAAWINANCAEGEFAYMIPHSMTYCPDTFKNVSLPDRPLEDKLDFGFGILGTHSFPTGLFEAKYVITADPFPWCYEVSSVAGKLNDQFFAGLEGRFALEARFDMGNGTVFTVYRRTAPATRAEAEGYLAAFAEEDAQFPELYSQVIEAWLAEQGL